MILGQGKGTEQGEFSEIYLYMSPNVQFWLCHLHINLINSKIIPDARQWGL